MPSLVSSSSLVAKLPSVTITRGRISSSWRSSHGAHASISSGCGSRLPGGRHFTTLAMYTSARVSPMPSISCVSSWPARPTNGSPLQVFLLARALADEHQVGVGAADAEHHLGAPGRELAQRAARRPRPRPRRASRRPRARDAGMRRTSRVTRHSPADGPIRPRTARDAIRGATRIASATTSAATARSRSRCASTDAGRERDREVAVEAGVRGRSARAKPSCALCATRWHAALSSAASVTTTTSVVLAPSSSNGASARERRRVGAARSSRRSTRPSAPTTSPTALTTASATTCASSTVARRDAEAAGTACSRPRHFPTVAPAPAPTRPVASGSSRRPRPRPPRSRRRRPAATPPDSTRSKMHAAGTIGTGPPAVGKPCPRSARKRITPSAAASPNAEPPDEHDRVDARDRARRVEQRQLARRGRAAAHLAGADRARRGAAPRSRRCRRRSSGRRARPRSESRHARHRRARRATRRRRRGRAPTSRAKSTISRSSSSVRSSISMCPPPGNSSSRAPGISSAMRRASRGRREQVGGAADHERRDPHVREIAR